MRRLGMNARVLEGSVVLGAMALTVGLYLCARECAKADVRRQLLEASDGNLWRAANSAALWPEAWIHDETVCEAVIQHLRRHRRSAHWCWELAPHLHGHRQEVWALLCAEIQVPDQNRAYDALWVFRRMGTSVPEPIVDDLWSWFVTIDKPKSDLRERAGTVIAAIESTAAGKQLLLRKWQAANETDRQRLVALGIVDPERRWQAAAK